MGLLINPVESLKQNLGFGGGKSATPASAPARPNTAAPSAEQGNPIHKRIYQGLRDRGLSHTVSLAAMANIGAESSFNPSAFNSAGGGQGAHGFFQWRGDRYNALKNLAKETGRDVYDIDNQLDHLVNELQSTEAGTMAALEGVTDAGEAARIFRTKFERPGGHGYENTARYANQFAGQFSEDGYVPNEVQPRKGAMLTFAEGAAHNTGEMNKLLVQQSVERSDQLQKQPGTAPLGFTPPPGGYTPPTMLPNGQPMIPGATPFSPGGQAQPGPTGPAAPNATLSTQTDPTATGGDEGVEPEKSPLMQRLGEMLFPNQEDPENALRNRLNALGVGLGQMSHGQPVDLQDFWGNVASQKQSIIDQQIEQQKLETDRMNAVTAAAQAQLASERLQLDYLELDDAKAQRNAPVFDDEVLNQYSQDEQLAPFVDMITSGNENTRKEGVDGLRSVLVERAKAASADSADGDYGRLMEELHRQKQEGGDLDMGSIAKIVDEEGLGSEDVGRAFTQLGMQPSAFIKDIDEYLDALETNPERARAMERAWQRQIGVDETPRERANREQAEKFMDQLDAQAEATYPIQIELENMERLTHRLIESGTTTGPFNDALAKGANAIIQAAGLIGMDWVVENTRLSDMTQFDQLHASEKALALLIAGPLMEGGGSISDSERKNMLDMVARGGTTPEVRLQMIKKLQAMNKVEQLIAEKYSEGLNADYSNARSYKRDIRGQGKALVSSVAAANEAAVGLNNINLSGFSYYKEMSPKDQLNHLAQPMTQEQYDLFGEALPTYLGDRFWKRKNDDGTLTLMHGNKEYGHDS